MYQTKDTTRKIRKRSFIFLIIDLVIIFIAVFYITNYVLVTKSVSIKGFKLRFKYMSLKEKMGYILNLSIETEKPQKIVLGEKGQVKFFIKNTEGSTLWKKWVFPQRKLTEIISQEEVGTRGEEFLLKDEDIMHFSAIYDNYTEGFLKDGDYLFGTEFTINNTNAILTIPVKIKEGKEKKLF